MKEGDWKAEREGGGSGSGDDEDLHCAYSDGNRVGGFKCIFYTFFPCGKKHIPILFSIVAAEFYIPTNRTQGF